MMPDKILVTGATGCLGSNLTRRLISEGAEVVVFKRHGDSLGPLGVLRKSFEVRFGDVRSIESVRRAMRDIKYVYHLAGIPIPLNRLEREMWEVNVSGTFNVCKAAFEHRVHRLVHVSSTAAIGYPPHAMSASESFDFADSVSTNAYSITKKRGEEIALGFNCPDFEVVVVNPSAVIAQGSNLHYGWAALVGAVKRGYLQVVPGGGSGFCAAADLVNGLFRAMAVGQAGERYILNSENLSYLELARLISTVVGVGPPKFVSPDWILRLIGIVNDGVAVLRSDPRSSPMLVSENVDLVSRRLYYDQSKAVVRLGLTQTPIIEAVRELYEWVESETECAIAA
jgi:dihydroflavonol-4-reductase